jgi:hypothetical protein
MCISGPRLNVDAIEHCNKQVDYQHIGAEQVYGHHNGGYPPAVQGELHAGKELLLLS